MKGRRHIAAVASTFAVACGLLVFVACDVDDEEAGPTRKPSTKTDGAILGDGAGSLTDAPTSVPGLCAKTGGYAKVQQISDAVYNAAAADCRIGIYFTRMSGGDQTIVKGCMQRQLGDIFQCPGITYAGSKVGDHECRGMTQAHNNLVGAEGREGLNSNDYTAYVQAAQGALKAGGLSDSDITSVIAVFNGFKQNVAPRTNEGNTYCTCANNQFNGQSCVPDGGYVIPVEDAGNDNNVPDTGNDTGGGQDTGSTQDADDSG